QLTDVARLERKTVGLHRPGVGRPVSRIFSGDVDPELRADAVFRRVVAQPLMAEAIAELVEIAVRRSGDRANEIGRTETAGGNVGERLTVTIPGPGIVKDLIFSDDAARERRASGHHLEGRTGRRRGADCAVVKRSQRVAQI